MGEDWQLKPATWRRKLVPRPPLWRFQQHAPRPLSLLPQRAPAPADAATRIAVVTPSFNHAGYIGATVDSVLAQRHPNLAYHVQDGGSQDGTVAVLTAYGDSIRWISEADAGQTQAINLGFAAVGDGCDAMAYLNSDDLLLPNALTSVAAAFRDHPDIDIVYGHRIIVDENGDETGVAIMPAHDGAALQYMGYVPQETMFWRRRVWERIGPFDESFRFAMDWDFMLRAQDAGCRFLRLNRFLGCFRVHAAQKTSAMMNVGFVEMQRLRQRQLGAVPSRKQMYRGAGPYLLKQFAAHAAYRAGLLKPRG